MRKKLVVLSFAALAAMILVCGCQKKGTVINGSGNNGEEETTEKVISLDSLGYTEILDRFYKLVALGYNGEAIQEDEIGIAEMIIGVAPKEALESVGYAVVDINDDSVPELVIGMIDRPGKDAAYGSFINALYTSRKNSPVLILTGWGRNSYKFMENGGFFYQGSSGAAQSAFGEFVFSQDGSSIECKDFYFTDVKDGNYDDLLYFHNQTGTWDVQFSEQLSTTSEKFWQMSKEYDKRTGIVELTPFAKYELSTGPLEIETEAVNEVKAEWADEVVLNSGKCDEFTIASLEEENRARIAFTVENDIKEFKLLAIELQSVDNDGNLQFDLEELYHYGDFSPKKALVGDVVFHGDTLEYGISYVDPEGMTRYYVLEVSGVDGSLIMTEFFR